jgi:hypothetical protein
VSKNHGPSLHREKHGVGVRDIVPVLKLGGADIEAESGNEVCNGRHNFTLKCTPLLFAVIKEYLCAVSALVATGTSLSPTMSCEQSSLHLAFSISPLEQTSI